MSIQRANTSHPEYNRAESYLLSFLSCCIFVIVFKLEPTSTIKFTNVLILSSSFNFNRSSCNLKAMFWLVELIPSNSAVFLFQTMCQPREKRLVILNTIDVELSHICFLYLSCCIFETVFQQTDLPSTIKFTNAVIISIIVVFLVFRTKGFWSSWVLNLLLLISC